MPADYPEKRALTLLLLSTIVVLPLVPSPWRSSETLLKSGSAGTGYH
ncbi:MAG: hypothetical protein P8Y70_06775 [Candidatus Lokiarchaeota archaeon]